MSITPEILKKYALGQCSEQERIAVEAWLETNDTISGELSDEAWEEADKLMWENLQGLTAEKHTPIIPFYKNWGRYVTAACLLLALSGIAYLTTFKNRHYNSPMSISTGDNKSKQITASGIAFTVFARSDAKIKANPDQTEVAIELCGKMQMIVADESRKAEIFAACNGQRVSRKVSFERGNKYLVFTENNKVMLVDYASLRQLSPYQKARIMHRISNLKIS